MTWTCGAEVKVRIRCESVKQRLTGHNNDVEHVYGFSPNVIFGTNLERLSGDFSFHSDKPGLFYVGLYYEMEIK